MHIDAAEIRESIRIDAAHPSLPGHFPGRPVVPGVVLLDRVAAALGRAGAGRFVRIGVVKFSAPLLPEQDAQLTASRSGARVRFRIEREGRPILSGEAELL
ncbi:MAG: hydroxymyristoyl-ACP dehydratase [Dokdonella sp.]